MSNGEKDIIQICGGKPLFGNVRIQGSKNAVLPIMAACLLIKGKTQLQRCPAITDVFYMKKLLQSIGCKVSEIEHADGTSSMVLDATDIYEYRLPGEYVEKMRSSIIILGPLLARIGEAHLLQPGGCTIGRRPIDLHLQALEKLGAEVMIEKNTLRAQCSKLTGTKITFPIVSVGATENSILAAVLAEGTTVIENAAMEPEIQELCDFLQAAGADITIEKHKITIQGVAQLHPIVYRVSTDRIVAGTYAFGTLAAGGCVRLEEAPISNMEATLQVVRQMGGRVTIQEEECFMENHVQLGTIQIEADDSKRALPYIETAVYPGFATDVQSAFLVAAAVSAGTTILCETIFEKRFQVVEELVRMGADMEVYMEHNRQHVCIRGVPRLMGCNVLAKELRGGGALVLAGIVAEGITCVGNIHFIERGYENIERDLGNLGASISQIHKDCRI